MASYWEKNKVEVQFIPCTQITAGRMKDLNEQK